MGSIGELATPKEDNDRVYLKMDTPKASFIASACQGSGNGPHAATHDPSYVEPNDSHSTGNAPTTPPIAIVGMAVRLPGDVRTMESFWDLLVSKRDVSTEVPESRFNIDAFYSESRPKTVKTRRGFFLNDELEKVDPSAFGMSNDAGSQIDPQQRLLLELVWECMESAGQVNWRGKDIGTYVGNFGEDWLEMCLRDPLRMQRLQVFGASDFSLSNRVSYEYDLGGPSMTVRTACSSSMVALHEACQSVASGECLGAIVAGSNIILTPTMTTHMSENMVLSVEGECKTFDADANGYGRGEGVSAIFIKNLDQAVRDGDPIRAVIRSTSTNSNGKSSKLAVPSAQAQSNLIRKAYQRAGISDPTRTGLFECHGTGTAAGDVAEAEAIARVFGARGVIIGAVKPNVGHSEVPFKEANLHVAKELLPWPEDRDERVSVNSFGIGGSNAHVILDSARSWGLGTEGYEKIQFTNNCPKLVTLSALSQDSLDQKIGQMATYLQDRSVPLQDLAYTLGERRDHWRNRAFAIVQQGAVTEPPVFKKNNAPVQKLQSAVFVFPGQGSQWPGMGKGLFEYFNCFREAMRALDRVLQALPQPPTWTLEEKFTTIGDPSCFLKAEYSQPLCAAVQIGLVDLLASWNIHPIAVIGHSSGEMVAAYAAKSITAETAITIAYYRGQASGSLKRTGGMASIGLSRDSIGQYLEDGVVLACENSLQSVVVSGDEDALVRVLDRVKEAHPDTFTGRLDVEMAYHSLIGVRPSQTDKKTDHMAPVGPTLEKMLHDRVPFGTPEVPFYSTVLGRVLTENDHLDAEYWRRNLESMVLFQDAVQAALGDLREGASCFLEIGPHCPLSGPLRHIFRDTKPKSPVHYVATLHKAQDEVSDALETAGQLFLQGLPISLSSINGPGKVLTDLPPYPWNYSKNAFLESRVVHNWRHRQFRHHELLGSRAMESSDLEPFWRNILTLENSRWLCDHKFSGSVIYPAAAHIAAVGEAVRQMTGATAFSIRNLFIKKALLLDEDKDLEIMTCLKPAFLTNFLDSDWFEFTVSSFNGIEWTKHCIGQVSGVQHPQSTVKVIDSFIRKVDASAWYKSLSKVGLDYGPYFQGLSDVSADPVGREAVGTIFRNSDLLDTDSYAIHPTLLDKALQLVTVAATRGISRYLDRIAIPISVDNIYVQTCTSTDLRAEADCHGTTNGQFTGNLFAIKENNVILDIRGITCFPMDSEDSSSDSSNSKFAQVCWKEDIEFMPSLSGILPPSPARYETEFSLIEQFFALNLIVSHRLLKDTTPTKTHFIKYVNWLNTQMRRFEVGEYSLVPQTKYWVELTVESQGLLLSKIGDDLVKLGSKWDFCLALMRRFNSSIKDIADGRINPLEVLMEDDSLERLYASVAGLCDYQPFLQALGHSRPSMRVLEIGAGTGTTTADILPYLQTSHLGRSYSEFFFTDISPGFFASAKERFRKFPALTFKTLNITQDPVRQGFQEGYFDLIIAANVLHATPCLQETLANTRKLLAPGGYLLLQELNPESIRVDFLMGVLPQWWLGADDGRAEKPYVSPERWDQELRSAGFTGVESISHDNVWPYQFNANMISRIQPSTKSLKVSLLYDGTVSESAKMVEQVFLQNGYIVDWFTLEQGDASHEHVISLLDLETSFFDNISETQFIAFQTYIANSMPKSMVWITRGIQMRCTDPQWSLTLGMIRTLRLELSIPCATFEMTSIDQATLASLIKVQQKVQPPLNTTLEPDYEYSSQGERVFTSRYFPTEVSTELEDTYKQSKSKRLAIATCGLLDTLHWVQFQIHPPGIGELEIEVKYVGLNFKDLMHAMGFIGSKDDIGIEATGVVQRVGPGPHGQVFQEGDRVFVVGTSLLRTSVVVPSFCCLHIPPKLSLEDAATVPVVFSTVIYTLNTLGGLRKGQSVLIHSAAGGVGLAAIQLCQLLGAEIYATVGSDAKAQYLIDKYQIPRHRIFNSRNPSFKDGVLGETNGKGVDIVLNSLSGESLHASWECVAEQGKMLEIGKRDMMGHGKLNMNPFSETMGSYLDQGALKPIEPKNVFEATDAQAAFRLMQTGQHMGKIVIKIPENLDQIPASVTDSPLPFSPDVSYVLVGGLGGLGIAIARWMVERGAKSLVFFSRSGNSTDETRNFVQELEAMGCTAIVVAGSVLHMEDVTRAISACPKPLAGVIQLAMVLQDHTFVHMTHEEWLTTLAPKITGTKNLYRAIQNHSKLEFFLMFGSIVSITSNIGQSNYAAANCFLDAFVKVCRAEGCPACVIQLGVMAGIGYVSQNLELRDKWSEYTAYMLNEKDLLQAVQVAIEKARLTGTDENDPSASTVLFGLQDFVRYIPREAYRTDRRFAPCLLSVEETPLTSLGSDWLDEFAASIKHDPSILNLPSTLEKLVEEIARTINGQYGEDESLKAPGEVEIDSLMTIEIRSLLRKRLNIDIPTLQISKAKNVHGLALRVIKELKVRYGVKDGEQELEEKTGDDAKE
ncbi:fatty acid synthase S-acetyltransferase [Penicillium longicatenatum]|uniref:fatty acid synthase S-acetyltransferase n=1 Tax=Penicillium longicatenatum TaxID=1561947 RepID=UPI00254822F3|nr:fatty acid synthase S-acetyltransferase [Penicillium longicatenatum]KAJ5631672.1 fatty acid synthase S-acetyltransferase [Penicillium longicatenatum]